MARRARQSDPETTREEAVNVLLAELLRDHGLAARAERRSREGVPDIRVELRSGDLVLLECKWEGSAGLLEHQLGERLADFPEALGTIGVLYPDRLQHAEDTSAALEEAADLQWWLHGSRGARHPEWRVRTGSAAELADELRTLPLELEGVDRVAAAAIAVGYALEQAAGKLTKHARISGRIADIIAKTDQEKDRAAALRIGCLVLFNAIAFQDRLAAVNEQVPTVDEALRRDLPGLRGAWRGICDDIDYVPVFELAGDILDVIADAPHDEQAPILKPLVKAMEATRRLEGHDLSRAAVPHAVERRQVHRRLLHVGTGGHAAFPAGVSRLAAARRLERSRIPGVAKRRRHRVRHGNPTDGGRLGSRTPTRRRWRAERRRAAQGNGGATLRGYDVQLSAVHFAATSLAMLNPDIQFNRMNLYVMPLGVEGSVVSLGSLDFLGEDSAAVQFALSAEDMGAATQDAAQVSGGGSRGAGEGVIVSLPELDLAIMNPPFTRSVGGNLLFGSLPAPERRQLQKELSRRLRQRRGEFEQRQGSSTPGLGAAFVATAAPKLRPGEGRLALVLPATVCTGPSWEQTRALIERNFALDMVIASHDPQRWNFSDSTDLSEVLLIATRRPSLEERDDAERHTIFVNLWQNPDGVLDAHRAAQAITTTTPARLEETGTALLEVDGQHIGEAFSMPESRLALKKWSGMQFARADMVRSALRLLDDGEVWIPGEEGTTSVSLCRLGEIGQVGPDRRDVWDGFERTDTVTAYPMVENHDTKQRTRLVTEPDEYLAPLTKPRPGRNLKAAAQLWPKAGRLLVAERLWLETARVAAMWSETRVLSNVWWPIRVEDTSSEKALAVWLNSSLGLLTLLAQRTSTRGGWVAMKKGDLEDIPLLDVRALSPVQLQALSDLFDELTAAEFERLPAMAHCPARQSLDDGVSRILGLPDLGNLRNLLASEPVVSNQRL